MLLAERSKRRFLLTSEALHCREQLRLARTCDVKRGEARLDVALYTGATSFFAQGAVLKRRKLGSVMFCGER